MFTLLSSGSNAHGQLANGSTEDSHEFRPCSFCNCALNTMPANISRVLNITSGANHTIVLLETCSESGDHNTQLWGSGDGSHGQLGVIQVETPLTIFRPIKLPLHSEGFSDFRPKLVEASWQTTYIVFAHEGLSDVLISMGADDFGNLGAGKGKAKKTFHVVSFDHLTFGGTPLKDAKITIDSLATGQHHIIAQLDITWNEKIQSCIVGWGTSRHGQLGDLRDTKGRFMPYISIPHIIFLPECMNEPILSVALGNQHTVFLQASGSIQSLGSNRKGQLQGLNNIRHAVKLGCTWNGTYVIADEGGGVQCIFATGSGAHGQLGRGLPLIELSSLDPVKLPMQQTAKVTEIACGTEHILVLLSHYSTTSPSEVWGWGWNEHGNLGIGTTENVFTPIQIWPPPMIQESREVQRVVGIWGGSGTSWIVVECT